MDRRHFLTTVAATATATAAPAAKPTAKRLGLTIASYANHRAQRHNATPAPVWQNALDVLDHCHDLGAGCLQIGVRGWSQHFASQVRDKRESLGITLEGQIGLPEDPGDLDRFESELRTASKAGATVLRCVCLGGRRYETFESLASWQQFVSSSRAALERAEPILAKHRLKLAVENHKDWRTAELLELMRHLDSEWVGVTFDYGNNLALLEDPHAVAAALAPHILTTHLKDMALQPYADGILLSEVPLGQGVLDLPKLIATCNQANPDVQFNLEMITRDPLKIPALTARYWTTMPEVPATDLARTLRLARGQNAESLPTTSEKSPTEKLAFEAQNIRLCFAHARRHLNL